jgi:tRNA (guanosine-2'-O-)-methyltransferase
VHWTGRDSLAWLGRQREAGSRVIAVELAEGAVRLADLPAARQRTVMLLGHEQSGVPAPAMELVDQAVEIPMLGVGHSLNVAVAGSLVLYRLAGLL